MLLSGFRFIRHSLKTLLVRFGYYSKPEFVIVGAQKAGTTSLFSYLIRHSKIKQPAYKEVHYFDKHWEVNISNKHRYFKNFELPFKFRQGDLTFEATPDYMFYPSVATDIKSFLPNAKIIIILRDPVKRAFSAWNMHHNSFINHDRHSHLYDPRSFEEAVEEELARGISYDDQFSYIGKGVYHEQIKRFVQVFSWENVLILENEQLRKDKHKTLLAVQEFIGLPPENLNEFEEESEFWTNTGNYRNRMTPEVKQLLINFYNPYNEELFKYLGVRYDWLSE